jgi:hypothetical protein
VRRWSMMAAACALFGAALWHLPATAQRTAAGQASAPAAPTQPAATQPATTQPAAAQSAATPPDDGATVAPMPRRVAPQLITFEEYRDFRLRDIAQRRERLARALTAADLSPAEKANLEARKAYYDRLGTMPATERDRLFRARFDQIDTDHDGMIDDGERAAWREKQRAHYRDLAAERAQPEADQH